MAVSQADPSQAGALGFTSNPTQGITGVQLPAEFRSGSLRIFDVLGTQVFEQKVVRTATSLQLDLGAFPAGVYLAVAESSSGRVWRAKLAKLSP